MPVRQQRKASMHKKLYYMENISIKIVNLIESCAVEPGKKYAIYEIEPYQYGDSNVTKMKIFYEKANDLDVFEYGKKYNIKLGKDKIFVNEENILVINDVDWNAQETWLQKATDTTKGAASKIGDASAKGVKKAGEGLGKAGKSLEGAADKNQWPRWVLPVGIVIGVLLLIGIIIMIFKPKKR